MSKIAVYNFVAHKIRFRERIMGTITMPRDSKVLYLGAGPPKGNLMAWVEHGSIVPVIPDNIMREYLILTTGDEVPPGYEFAAPLFANPILFVYELKDAAAFSQVKDEPRRPSPKLITGGKS